MDLKNKTVMVVGTGISGIGAVDLLNKVGAEIGRASCRERV